MNNYIESTYKFGLIGGVFCIISFLVFAWMGLDPTNFNMIFGYVLIPIFVFLGIRYFKNHYNAGFLSFAHGMSTGFLIYTLIALVSGLGIWLILLISPTLFEQIRQSKIEVMESNKDLIVSQLSEKSFDITFQSVLNTTPFDIALNDFIWKIIPGLFFTIIISIILRKNN